MPRGQAGKLRDTAKAIYRKQATRAELAAFGFRPEDYAHEQVSVWPDNYQAVSTFIELQTQWRVGGMGSATGLDYVAALAVIRELDLEKDEARELFQDIRVMEAAALEQMAEDREKDETK